MVLTVHTPATGDEPDTKKQKMDVNEQPTLPSTADTTQDTKGHLMPSLPSLPTDDTSPPAATATTSNASTPTTLPLLDEEQTQRIKSSSELGTALWKCAGCGLNENECNTPLLLFEDPEEADPTSKEGEDGKKCEEEKR